ncbi:MAG: hypothetical protein Q4G04_03365 [bacterium]|nr:hypothetical protein [bacterium]
MNGYLIPANAKKGTLILNLFTMTDVIILGVGLALSFLFLALSPTTTDTVGVILIMIPAGTAIFLVIPIANYHNVRVALRSIFRFFTERRKFIWKGWCYHEYISEENGK